MRIAYLLPETEISATARIVAAQADALIANGHEVRIVSPASPPTWRSSRAEWIDVDDVRRYVAQPGEITIDSRSQIVQENPIVDDDFYGDPLPRENQPLRVLIAGGSQFDDKGIGQGYGAVTHARWFHQTLDFIRVSPWAPSREEPLDDVQEFHVALTAREMTRLMHSCDVLVAPNRREDPLSLTTLEAFASGLGCVITSTPQHLRLGHECALFAPPDNAVELGEKLIEVLSDAGLRQRLRAKAREAAEPFRPVSVVKRLEQALASRLPSPAE